MSNAKISIILIYKNNEDKIKYCLESIFNQKFCDYELICINNGSEDKSEEIVQEYKENRENVILINFPTERDIQQAQKSGLDLANGDYVCFIDPEQVIYENFPGGIKADSFTNLPSNIKIENGRIYKRDFLENQDILDTIIENKLTLYLQKMQECVKNFENTVNLNIDKVQKTVIENVESKLYITNLRTEQLEKIVYEKEINQNKLVDDKIKEIYNLQENTRNDIYNDMSKIYEYINTEISKRIEEINKVYNEITNCYKYSEELNNKSKEQTENNKKEMFSNFENITDEISLRYSNIIKLMDIQTEELNKKLEEVKEELSKLQS